MKPKENTEKEIVESSSASSRKRKPTRRIARETAVKASYAIEIKSCEISDVLSDPLIIGDSLPPAYTVRLMSNVARYKENLDDIIREKVVKWDFHRIAIIDRIILRLAITELIYFPDIPPKVAINEAIELAKIFSTIQSGGFVNGILDAIATDIKSGKFKIS